MARKILDTEPGARERAADEVSDRLSAYSPDQASALATLLSAAAVSEKDIAALESELHAILELTATGHVTRAHLAQLKEMRLDDLPRELREYVTDLLEG
ncbi:hypothetical protein ACFY8K_07345 [Streptomyces misionensis]|uniref:hypothetical protein n=1 Tax=Streptomyces misionensis TaxID=67331 RepID=UPI00367E46D1